MSIFQQFCIVKQVADVGPILDMIGVVLESIPTGAVAARATINAVHRTAQIVSSLPNTTYYKKVDNYYGNDMFLSSFFFPNSLS